MTQPPLPLLGLPNLTDLLGKLNFPGKAELDAFKTDVDDFADAITKVTGYADKYGSFIPGASAVIGPLDLLTKSLGVVKTLLDYVP